MSLFNNFADRMIATAHTRAPDETIGGERDPYLCRWHLARTEHYNIYLHRFQRSDDDRALLDHPWHSLSFTLRGNYYELRDKPSPTSPLKLRRAGSLVFRSARTRHRIILPVTRIHTGTSKQRLVPIPCYTLFITGPRIREWGFYCPQGFVHWRDFTAGEHGEIVGKGCGE